MPDEKREIQVTYPYHLLSYKLFERAAIKIIRDNFKIYLCTSRNRLCNEKQKKNDCVTKDLLIGLGKCVTRERKRKEEDETIENERFYIFVLSTSFINITNKIITTALKS